MDVALRRKPKSRLSRTPVTSFDGVAKAVPPHRLTDQDVKLLTALARRRFFSADYLAAIVGTSYKYALQRVQILKSQPNCYIKICDTQAESPKLHLYTPLFYELDSKGITELAERGLFIPSRKPVKNLIHAVMVDQIMASFELGELMLIPRADILTSENTPAATRKLAVPDRIPVGDHGVRPDGEMFVLKSPSGFRFFPGIEADTGTEPIHSYDYDRSSIKAKFEDYIKLLSRRFINHTLVHGRSLFPSSHRADGASSR
jgi:hypothetical protein